MSSDDSYNDKNNINPTKESEVQSTSDNRRQSENTSKGAASHQPATASERSQSPSSVSWDAQSRTNESVETVATSTPSMVAEEKQRQTRGYTSTQKDVPRQQDQEVKQDSERISEEDEMHDNIGEHDAVDWGNTAPISYTKASVLD